MKRPQPDVGFAYVAHALARRAEEVHVRLAARGVECASRFEVAGRGGRMSTAAGRVSALVEPADHVNGMAATEPALPTWRGTLAGAAPSLDTRTASEPPRTSGLVTVPGPLARGRR